MAQPDVITIALRFGVDTALGLYQDTLYFSESEWAKRDPVAIEAAKQKLADTWVTFYSAQIAEAEALRTEEGKKAKIAEIDTQIADLTAAKEALAVAAVIDGV
jgi:ribosomal protein L18